MSKNLLNILKTNVACCKAAGNPFITQLSRLYIDLLSLYRILSEKVSTAVEQNGQDVLKVRGCRVFLKQSSPLNVVADAVAQNDAGSETRDSDPDFDLGGQCKGQTGASVVLGSCNRQRSAAV